jgi:hypothetical protein
MKFRSRILATITAITLLHLLAICTQAQTWSVSVYGCLAGGSTTASVSPNQVAVRTGNQGLDHVMVEDITELDRQFGVSVPVYFLNSNVENAFFTPTKFPSLISADGGDPNMIVTGSMFVTSSLLISEYRATNGSLMSIPAIMGHEFAHAMQYKNGFPYRGRWRELHADYMAGWFIAHRGRFRPQNALQAFINFYNKGDSDFYSEDHHGTPQERGSAFYAGYMLNVARNEASAINAYNAGLL